jgi:hypothetical protein
MRRSVGVMVIAILALIGSAGVVGIGALALLGIVAGGAAQPRDFSGSPMFFRAIMLLAPLIYILPGVWGIVTAIGLMQLKNWARISIIVFSVLLLVFGLITGLSSSGFFLTNPPSGMDRQEVAFVRVFMLMLAAALIGVGVWWLVFFNRARVKQQFAALPMFAGFPAGTAGYPIQPSYHVQPPPATSMPVVPQAPQRPQRPLSITIIAWLMLVGCLFLPINLALHTPASLFVWVLTGWRANAFFLIVVALLVFIGIGLLRLNPYARVVGIGYFAFAILNSAVFFFAPGGRARMARMVELQHSLFPGLQGASPQIDPRPFILVGGVIGLLAALVPLYFLVTKKHAFQKSLVA